MNKFEKYRWEGAEELKPEKKAYIPPALKSLITSSMSGLLSATAGSAEGSMRSDVFDKIM